MTKEDIVQVALGLKNVCKVCKNKIVIHENYIDDKCNYVCTLCCGKSDSCEECRYIVHYGEEDK